MLWSNHSFAIKRVWIGTVSWVNNKAHGPLVCPFLRTTLQIAIFERPNHNYFLLDGKEDLMLKIKAYEFIIGYRKFPLSMQLLISKICMVSCMGLFKSEI